MTKSPTRYQLVKKVYKQKNMQSLIRDHRPKVSRSSASPTVHWIAVINNRLESPLMHHITILFTLRFLCLINTLYSRLYQLVKKVYKLKKHAVTKSPTTDLRCRSPVLYQLCTGLLWSMAIWINTGVYWALVSKKLKLL